MKRKTVNKILIYILLVLGLMTIVIPLYITFVTSFKSTSETITNYLSLPKKLYLGNFQYILTKPGYWQALRNTAVITFIVACGDVLIMPMLGYSVGRRMSESKGWNRFYFFLLLGIFIPFQVKMIPIVQMMSALKMLNPIGLATLCIGSTTCEATFLYTGYLTGVPRDLEEAASIDGSTTFNTYKTIIFPLMKPIISTSVIKDCLWTWNDFTLPLITLNRSPQYWTLVLYQYNFQTEAGVDYGLVFACLCISIIPILIIYLFLQKQIMSGLTSGAVKG
jgi:raffinose/stachyose/melibiose transport system permease protein